GDVKDVESELERINGVADVNYAGGITEQFEVIIIQSILKDNKITQDDIVNLINAHEIALPGGTVETDDHTLTTRVLHSIDGKDGLKDLAITDDLKLSDIADVKLDTEKQTAITRANQQPALQLTAMKE